MYSRLPRKKNPCSLILTWRMENEEVVSMHNIEFGLGCGIRCCRVLGDDGCGSSDHTDHCVKQGDRERLGTGVACHKTGYVYGQNSERAPIAVTTSLSQHVRAVAHKFIAQAVECYIMRVAIRCAYGRTHLLCACQFSSIALTVIGRW